MANARATGNVRVWSDGDVYFGPTGTAAPTTPTGSLNAAFLMIGWLSSDGITRTQNVDSTDITAWQNGTIVRRQKTKMEFTFKFQALEENANTLALTTPGSTTTVATSVATTQVKASLASDRRMWVFDFLDGTIHKRIVVPIGEVTDFGDVTATSDGASIREYTVTAYPDAAGNVYTILTDDPAIVTP